MPALLASATLLTTMLWSAAALAHSPHIFGLLHAITYAFSSAAPALFLHYLRLFNPLGRNSWLFPVQLGCGANAIFAVLVCGSSLEPLWFITNACVLIGGWAAALHSLVASAPHRDLLARRVLGGSGVLIFGGSLGVSWHDFTTIPGLAQVAGTWGALTLCFVEVRRQRRCDLPHCISAGRVYALTLFVASICAHGALQASPIKSTEIQLITTNFATLVAMAIAYEVGGFLGKRRGTVEREHALRVVVNKFAHTLSATIGILRVKLQTARANIAEHETSQAQIDGALDRLAGLKRLSDGLYTRVPAPAEYCILDFQGLARAAAADAETRYGRAITISSEAEDCDVIGRLELLRDAMDNLLHNACEAADSFVVCHISKRVVDGLSCVTLYVANDGSSCNIGMAFTRGFSSRTGHQGLGLSIVQTISAEHRGFVHGKSRAGLTEFYFGVPAAGALHNG